MKYQTPENLKEMKPYQPITSHPPIRMDANEGCFPIPKEILAQFKESLDTLEFNRYPDPYGKKLSAEFSKFYGIDPTHVVLGNGSDELLFLLFNCMVGDNQKLLSFAPDFAMYEFYAHLRGINSVSIPKPERVEDFNEEFVLNKIKEEDPAIIIFSNPCNPTSFAITKEGIRKIMETTNALVILDEAYMDFGEDSFIPYYREFENLVILKTASKGIGFANARLGFFINSGEYTELVKKIKSPYNVNGISQLLGEIVFKNEVKIRELIGIIKEEKVRLYNALSAKYYVPKPSGNFLMVATDKSTEIKESLLEKDISIKDMKGKLRVTVGTPEENSAFLEAMEDLGYL